MADSIISEVNLPPAARILDIGTGTGGMIPVLSKFGKLIVYEPDEETLEWTRESYGKEYPEVTFVSGETVDVCQGRHDLITAFDVLEHCRNDDEALQTWTGLMSDQGHLLLTVPAFSSLWGRNDDLSHHYRRYTKASLKAVLTRNGFTVHKLTYTYLVAFLPVWISRNIKEKLEAFLGKQSDEPWDFELPPAPVNELLYTAVGWESSWLARSSLPLGTSVLALAQR